MTSCYSHSACLRNHCPQDLGIAGRPLSHHPVAWVRRTHARAPRQGPAWMLHSVLSRSNASRSAPPVPAGELKSGTPRGCQYVWPAAPWNRRHPQPVLPTRTTDRAPPLPSNCRTPVPCGLIGGWGARNVPVFIRGLCLEVRFITIKYLFNPPPPPINPITLAPQPEDTCVRRPSQHWGLARPTAKQWPGNYTGTMPVGVMKWRRRHEALTRDGWAHGR